MSDDKPKDGELVKEDLSLDEVHSRMQDDLDKEVLDESEDKPKDGEVDAGEDKPKDDEPKPEDKKDDEPVVDDKSEPEPKTPEPASPLEDEADTLQAIQEKIPKVKVKDSEGVVHEFSSTDEIPDDFEPSTYKDFAVATSKLAQREIAVDKAVADDKTDKDEKARLKRIDEVSAGWKQELGKLRESGKIDKDEAKSKDVVDGIYQVMQDEMNAGTPVRNLTQAFEIYQYRESIKKDDERVKSNNDEKKRRGAMVLPGGGANPGKPNPRSGKVFEAPPTGVSLDQVHERTLSQL